jgi:hypothetical protein
MDTDDRTQAANDATLRCRPILPEFLPHLCESVYICGSTPVFRPLIHPNLHQSEVRARSRSFAVKLLFFPRISLMVADADPIGLVQSAFIRAICGKVFSVTS